MRELLTIAGPLLGILISAVVGPAIINRITARATADTAKETSAVDLVRILIDRVEGLEDDLCASRAQADQRVAAVSKLHEEALDRFRAAVAYINRVGLWRAAGGAGPFPAPGDILAPHVDVDLFTPKDPHA